MNETTLAQLKIIVERAVRPVRASTSRKRKIREELLAHLSGVFAEESAKLGSHSTGEQAAVERTAERFGNPADVTSLLQESVPASDGILRFCEGRPDASTLRAAVRFAWIESTIILLACGAALFAAEWVCAWSSEELVAVVSGSDFVPFWLFGPLWFFGVALVAHWMEKSLQGPEPLTDWPRCGLIKSFTSAWAVPAVRMALIAGSGCFFLLLCFRCANWSTAFANWDYWIQIVAGVLLTGNLAAATVITAWFLVQSAEQRRRYHEEWASLPIEPSL